MLTLETTKKIEIDITKIECKQQYGYQQIYYKVAPIKHRKKRIIVDDIKIWLDTKISDLIAYGNEYTHDNNFMILFVYRYDIGFHTIYFKRKFNQFGETFEIIKEAEALRWVNKYNSLF